MASFGNSNTKFFYAALKRRKATNCIKKCRLQDGNYTEDLDTVNRHAVQFFHNLLNQPYPTGNWHFSPKYKLNSSEAIFLSSAVTDEEIKRAVFQAPKNKSPCPDGYSAEFFQETWTIIGEDVLNAVKHFFTSKSILKQLNCTFISLIPKKEGAESFEFFRPILGMSVKNLKTIIH